MSTQDRRVEPPAVAFLMGRASGEASAPLEGVLRLLLRCPDGSGAGGSRSDAVDGVSRRGNYPLAVALPSGAPPLPISLHDGAVKGGGLTARLTPEGLEVHGSAPQGTLTPLFTIRSVHETPQGHFAATLAVGTGDPFVGLGEQPGPMNRAHRRVVCWNLDHAPHTPSTPSMYASFPVFLSRRLADTGQSAWYGVFLDNAGRSVFDLQASRDGEVVVAVDTGDLDLYIMVGPTPRDVVRRYCALTGTMELLPRWMLGYQQSRWSYVPAERVLEVARGFREHDFACDVIYLDIDYMDRFRAFTWDSETFPDPQGLVDELHALGFKVIPILNSAVAVDPDFDIYAHGHAHGFFLKRPDGTEYQAQMWPGRSAFPDFTRAEVRRWWGDLHADLLALGVDGIWNDMNEPTVFGDTPAQTFPLDLVHEGEGFRRPHGEVHNAYGMLMDVATHDGLRRLRPERRLPLLSRSAWAGAQRHAFVWTGDNSAWWEHMRMCIAQVCNLGLSGMAVSGPDVGGFHDECSGEMFLRWLQLAVFLPYLRAHTAMGTRDAEPWTFGPGVLERARRAVRLRYALLPYLYTLAAEAARHGDPITRPLLYEFPDDPAALAAEDQLMLGPHLLVAPIVAPGQTCRAVYLPPGDWVSFFDDAAVAGGRPLLAEASLDHIPVYVRANAPVPMARPTRYVGEPSEPLVEWHIWPSHRGEGHGWLYEDDGETDGAARGRRGFCETHVRVERRASELVVTFAPRVGAFAPPPRAFEIVLHGQERPPRECNAETRHAGGNVRARFDDDGRGRQVRFSM